jgi:hypothetical protein
LFDKRLVECPIHSAKRLVDMDAKVGYLVPIFFDELRPGVTRRFRRATCHLELVKARDFEVKRLGSLCIGAALIIVVAYPMDHAGIRHHSKEFAKSGHIVPVFQCGWKSPALAQEAFLDCHFKITKKAENDFLVRRPCAAERGRFNALVLAQRVRRHRQRLAYEPKVPE